MPSNTWRHNPPCKAHLILNEMFEKGKITGETTAKVENCFHPEFSKYTMPVFSNNFRQLRQLHPTECKFEKLIFLITLVPTF